MEFEEDLVALQTDFSSYKATHRHSDSSYGDMERLVRQLTQVRGSYATRVLPRFHSVHCVLCLVTLLLCTGAETIRGGGEETDTGDGTQSGSPDGSPTGSN